MYFYRKLVMVEKFFDYDGICLSVYIYLYILINYKIF